MRPISRAMEVDGSVGEFLGHVQQEAGQNGVPLLWRKAAEMTDAMTD
jgi:hypothetical protein